MNKQHIIEIIIFGMLLLIIYIILIITLDNFGDNLIYIQCCGGNQCTDTYYTQEDNLCHLTLCENNPFQDKSKCTYEGASFDMLSKL